MCAGAQDKFWPYHDRLFADVMTWGPSMKPDPLFVGMARDLKLDVPAFENRQRAPRSLGELRVVVPGPIAPAQKGDESCVLAVIIHSEHVFYQGSQTHAAGCSGTVDDLAAGLPPD